MLEPFARARPSVRAVELRRALARRRRSAHGAALADGRGGISTAHGYPHGFSLADQEDGATMTTWAHLTELFSSLPWFKMRDPRGVARKFAALRAARRRASLHIKILSLSTCFLGMDRRHPLFTCFLYAPRSRRCQYAREKPSDLRRRLRRRRRHTCAARALSSSSSPVLLSFEISYILAVSASNVFRVLPRTSSPSAGGCILGSGSGGRDAELARRGRSRRACKAWPYTDRDLGQGQSPYS